MPHSTIVRLLGCGLFLLGTVCAADEAKPVATPKAKRLEAMRDRAQSATISFKEGDVDHKIEFLDQPLFRYDDRQRGFRDGTLWIWSSGGRPVAIGKIEDLHDAEKGPRWLTCLTSLSPELIAARWPSGMEWDFKKPGVDFKVIKNGAKPSDTESGRLRQFKSIAQSFTISMKLYSGDQQELRPLARELHRYKVPKENISDAIVFGWTANGTNPDAIVLLELHEPTGKPSEWRYSLAPVTADKLWLKRSGEVVQTKELTMYPGDETLTFFFEKNESPID